jgi:hypothetical protein
MSKRRIAAALAVAIASTVTACSAATPRVEAPVESAVAPSGVTIPTDSGNVRVPAGTGGTVGSGGGTAGPNEKEQQRGNTPPGMSRDGAGPAGGAIVDPAGATGKR